MRLYFPLQGLRFGDNLRTVSISGGGHVEFRFCFMKKEIDGQNLNPTGALCLQYPSSTKLQIFQPPSVRTSDSRYHSP